MGMKYSKHIDKRYRVRGKIRPVRWNYTDDLPINDPMNDPTYNLQGEPDESTIDTPRQVNDDVWIRRDDYNRTVYNADQGGGGGGDDDDDDYNDDIYASQYDSGEFTHRETVLQGTVTRPHGQQETVQHETEPTTPELIDHYDMINDSEIDQSDTEEKQVISTNKNNDHMNVYHRFPKHRNNYEQLVRIFQPLIEKNVNVKRLLPYLPFLSSVECKIRAIEERDPHAAIIYLIDELCSNNNAEPGRWKQFIQSLEACGYKYIVDTLRGEENIDHTYQRQYLKIITPVLRQLIEPHEVLHALWACDVISSEDKEEVIQTQRISGSIAATDKLLDMVPRRHQFWYSHLVDALTNAGRHEAADMLAIPEILDSGGENMQKDKNNEKYVDESKNLNRDYSSSDLCTDDYLEMTEKEHCNQEHMPESPMYLDCSGNDNTCDNDEIDELYRNIRNPDNKPDGILNSLENSLKSTNVDNELCYEEYNPKESGDMYKSLDEGLTDYLSQLSSIPPSPPPRLPPSPILQDHKGLKLDCALKIDIHDDSNESNSIEVIRLTTPEPRKSFFPEHIPNNSNKVKQLNKLPVPTPRTRKGMNEVMVKPSQTQSNDQLMCTDIDKPSGPKRRIGYTLVKANTEHKDEGTDQSDRVLMAAKLIVDNSKREDEDIIEEETDIDSKRVWSKGKTTIKKRKNKLKIFKKTKINSRRKSLKITSNPVLQNHIGAICKTQRKRIALKNRERLALPKIQMNPNIEEDKDYNKSKSLPTSTVKGLGRRNGSYQFEEAIRKSDNEETVLSYSEPFNCFRRKEDEDIFATVGQFLPNTKPKRNQNNLLNFPLLNFRNNSQQRSNPETDELLDILESCNTESNADHINLKSNTEIKVITKDNLNPELKNSLQKVRELESKLNHEVHNGKVLRKALQLQGDVNEVLKQNKHTLSHLNIKEKEAKAIEAAMTGELYDAPEPFALYESHNKSLLSHVDNTPNAEASTRLLIEKDRFMREEEYRNKENKWSQLDIVKGDTLYKDSAFCSELTTKL